LARVPVLVSAPTLGAIVPTSGIVPNGPNAPNVDHVLKAAVATLEAVQKDVRKVALKG